MYKVAAAASQLMMFAHRQHASVDDRTPSHRAGRVTMTTESVAKAVQQHRFV